MAGETVEDKGAAEPDIAASIAAMNDKLEGMGGAQAQMHEFLQSEPWKDALSQVAGGPAPAGEEKDGEFDWSFLDDEDGGGFGEEKFDPARLAAGLAPVITKAIGEATAPLQEQLNAQQHEAAVNHLLNTYPELQDDAVAGDVVKTAREMAAKMGAPALGESPMFWEQTYLAGRTLEQARQEGTAPPAVAHLEGAGGAGPGGGGQGNLVDSIMNVKQGSGVLPFQ